MKHGDMDMQQGDVDMRHGDMQLGQAAWTSSMDMQHEYATWTCSINMQHGHIDTHQGHGHAASTDMDMTWIQNSIMNNIAEGQIVPVYYIAES